MNRTFRNALSLVWMMPLLVLGPGNANAQSDADRARMEYERQQREYWRAQEDKQREERRLQEERDRMQKQYGSAHPKSEKSDSGSAPSSGSSSSIDPAALASQHKAIEQARANLLRKPALAPAQNPLLGKWRVERDERARKKDELGELMGMLANPQLAACEMVFGEGTTEFHAGSWSAKDSTGDDSLGPVEYRMEGKTLYVLPKQGLRLLAFEIVDKNRIKEVRLPGCALVRVDSSAPTKQANTAANAPSAAARPSVAQPPVQTANVSPTPPVSSRPPPEICRQTLLDKLGVVGLNQVRQVLDVRFKETLRGTVPNSQNLRLDARGSACDDPRLNATLYDFDVNGMLQSITYVWARPAGPAPAPIFSERITQLSRFHSLPAPQSPSRLQADTSMGRLILEDLPQRNLLLEAYSVPK